MGEDSGKETPLQESSLQMIRTEPAASAPDRLERLFQAHHRRVFRAAYRVTGNASDAEDVLQTVFLRLARRGEDLGLGDSAGSYLHRAAVNAGLDTLRARARAKTVDLDDGEHEPPAPDPAPEGRIELRQRLSLAIAKLSPKAAEVFTLRYIEGYGNSEIADMLGASRTTIAVILHRARHQLQKALGSRSGVLS